MRSTGELELIGARQSRADAEARLDTARSAVEHLKSRLAVLPRNVDDGAARQAIADAVAFVGVRQRELVDVVARYDAAVSAMG